MPPSADYVWRATVPYFQFDQQGVVFNMWYLAWCDEAYSGFLGAIGAPYDALVAAGHDQQVVHSELDWRSGVRPEDGPVAVSVGPTRIGRSSFELEFAVGVDRGGELVEAARVRSVYVNVCRGVSTPLPVNLREALQSAAV